ncbi:MAG TPA: hypothetical protein VGS21_07840, partial [Acidimicrobiales bacterium]|nr:hypothetical protein [Acidimicrobiales bacterium]
GVAIANPSAPPVVSGCPADIGSGTIIVFGYGTAHPDADVWYADSGCQDITNGTVSGVELANPSFLSFISAFNTAFQTRGAAG